jgi:hypothetical protein
MRPLALLRPAALLILLASGSTLRAGDVLTVADGIAAQHLRYVYGSNDPSAGGLDCSGFVQVVFRQACGLDLPAEADQQLLYCRQHGQVWDAASGWKPDELRPGDLIFYAGPDALPRASQVSHVMIYCGQGISVGAQGLGRQLTGDTGGVGYFRFHVRTPKGIVGESGDRFIGHRAVFAYARLTPAPEQVAPLPPSLMAILLPPLSHPEFD